MSLLLVQADSRHLPFADGSVQTCVTSPPYWGLRDYGTATWEGGAVNCEHRVGGQVQDTKAPGAITTGQRPGVDASRCRVCGAVQVDAQLGLEATPDAYVAGMVAVFREVWRVLRDDGTCWLNLGDGYARDGGAVTRPGKTAQAGNTLAHVSPRVAERAETIGLKPKDLVGIPWMVAFALRADGWYLRSDIIWSKPNPMPESVTDRPTKAHEYVFLLSKAQSYYFDADAVREVGVTDDRPRSTWTDRRNSEPLRRGDPGTSGHVTRTATLASGDGRNIRSVWHIATQPYPGAHFATMPEKLVERCVLAGSKSGDVVLDPFIGSGTVARVALRLGRKAIGCDLNAAYLKLADDRTRVTYGLPLEVA